MKKQPTKKNEESETLELVAEFTGADRGNIWEMCGRDQTAWSRAERFRYLKLPESLIQSAIDYCNDRMGEVFYEDRESFMRQFNASQRAAEEAVEQFASDME
jgi:hypothetical protein